jgi:hypothetical protein
MYVSLTAFSTLAEFSDYAIVGVFNTQTGQLEMQAEPVNPEAASYTISGAIDLSTGEIAINAITINPAGITYTVCGSLNPQTGQLLCVRAKPESARHPTLSVSGSIDFATGEVALTAESQQSRHPNYRIRNRNQ